MVKVRVDKNNWKDTVPIVVSHMRDLEMMMPASDYLIKTRSQYADMASGGNGGLAKYSPIDWKEESIPSIREYNYPDAPDEFFAEVCDLLQWPR